MKTLIPLLLITFSFSCARKAPPVQCPKVQVLAPPKKNTTRVGALEFDGIPKIPAEIQKRMLKYQGARGAAFMDWDYQSGGMLIGTRFGNTTQIHHVKEPLSARKQLTFYKEPVHQASWLPQSYDGTLLLFMDQGGAENNQLYQVDLLEGKTIQLTKNKSRTVDYIFSSKGTLAYANNERNGKDFDIYLRRPKAKESKRIYEAKGLFMPIAFSNDESKLILQEYISLNKINLHLLDLNTLKITPIGKTDPETKIANRHACFGAKDKSILLTSDRDGEFIHLYQYDIAKQKFKNLTSKLNWNIEHLTCSSNGKDLAIVVNEGGFSRLYITNTRRPKLNKKISIPDGMIRNLKFGNGKKTKNLIGFSLHRPIAPSDAFSYDLRRRKLVQWTKGEVGGLNTDFFISPTIIKYATFDKNNDNVRMIPAFYFKPTQKGKRPVVIYIHGGPEAQYRPYFHPMVHYLVMEMGVAVIAPNVRGSDGYGKSYLLLDNGMKRADSVKDIGALLDWIKDRPELDPNRVVVYGGSYGGFMVLSSLVNYSKRLAGGVDWVGISNFVSFLKNTKSYRRNLRRAEYGDERDPKMHKYLTEVSPLTHVDKIDAPLFVIQGANDPRVPQSEAEQIVKALRAKNKTVWYLLAHNEGHGFRKKFNRDMAYMLTVYFFEKIGLLTN